MSSIPPEIRGARPALIPSACVLALMATVPCALAQHPASYQANALTVAGAATGTAAAAAAPRAEDLPAAPSALPHPLDLNADLAHVQAGYTQPQQPGAIPLTLDQAIATALRSNTQLIVSVQQERYVRAEVASVENALLPNLTASAYSRAQEINLAAMGFKPGTINIPGFNGSIAEIVKVNTTSAQLALSQTLSLPALYLYRAAAKATEAANWSTLSARGGVVLQVGELYLQALAEAAQVRNAQALLKQDQLVFEHARASRDAGVGINLDVLRAQVELQNEQQELVNDLNAEAKTKIQLNRAMGQPAGQPLDLVDAVPFAEFDANSGDDALKADLAIAFERRKDLRGLEAQLAVAAQTSRALKYERVPVLGVGGFYGVLGETTGSYHGVFTAEGRLSIPIFLEAEIRGQREVASAQQRALAQQIDARRSQIEADIRSSLFDVQSAAELVKVARSNVVLATQALADATERFTAGVDDNLPIVRAQATLEGAQSQLIQSEFQYNDAKLQLARNTGVVETEYKRYLGK